MVAPTSKPAFPSVVKAESSSLIPLLVIIVLSELLRYLNIATIDPFPYLVIGLVYAAFTSYGILSLVISGGYLLIYLQTGIIHESVFVGYLLSLPFVALLINLMKASLHTKFNPKLELNLEKLKAEAEMEDTKREFISLAAHQLRTPLGAMRWNLEALLAGKKVKLETEAKDAITEVYSGTLRMITLVNDLLDINKLLRGQFAAEKQPIDLTSTMQSLIHDLDYLTHKNEIKLKFNPSETATVFIDPKALHEVLLNVITNAIKYSKTKGEVVVATAQSEKEITISVSDSGIGIANSDNDKLFNKFYRGENAVAAVSDGSGLGLYLVKLLVTNWNGRVWYTSQLNQGTTFFITIPRHE